VVVRIITEIFLIIANTNTASIRSFAVVPFLLELLVGHHDIDPSLCRAVTADFVSLQESDGKSSEQYLSMDEL
jgi:hypothetical protein